MTDDAVVFVGIEPLHHLSPLPAAGDEDDAQALPAGTRPDLTAAVDAIDFGHEPLEDGERRLGA